MEFYKMILKKKLIWEKRVGNTFSRLWSDLRVDLIDQLDWEIPKEGVGKYTLFQQKHKLKCITMPLIFILMLS